MEKPTPKDKYVTGMVVHTSVDGPLLKRIDDIIKDSDYESRPQFGRVALRRLCDSIEKRNKEIAKAKAQEDSLTK